jgi:hypothetical protein
VAQGGSEGDTDGKRSYVVFISHSSRDAWIARMMAEKVSALGAEAWLDVKDLAGGDVITAKILEGLDTCEEAVVLVSPNSVGSQWVVFEIGAVWGQHKRVTPILNNVSFDAIAPLKEVKAIDLNDFDRFLSELGKRVKKASEV